MPGRRNARAAAVALAISAACAHAARPPQQTVLLDAWFDSAQRTAPGQAPTYLHYKWNDSSDAGFSLFGELFRSQGIATETLAAPPTPRALSAAQYYILAAPDTAAVNPARHLITPEDVAVIAAWVHAGGVLLLMANDPAHTDIPELDRLADRFGLHFNNVLAHPVEGRDLAEGRVSIPAGNPVFRQAYSLFLKNTCSLTLHGDAQPVATDNGAILMADARYGRGTVFAVTDPWLYNEYVNGKNLPPSFDNLAAGRALVRWLIARHAGR